MEHLNKQQLVLLAIFISFITSVVTGIVVVSLMSQEPVTVPQIVNQVVERTIEKVTVAAPENSNKPAQIITKETIVVKADDLIVDAISKNKSKVVKIFKTTEGVEGGTLSALGLLMSSDGLVVTDGSFAVASYEQAYALLDSGEKFNLIVVKSDSARFTFVKLLHSLEQKFSGATLADSDQAKLGQTIIAINGAEDSSVATGIISSFITKTVEVPGETATSTPKTENIIIGIRTNIDTSAQVGGSPIMNLQGEIVGLRSTLSGASIYVPINIVKADMETIVYATSTPAI